MMVNPSLKPCPFCGGKAKLIRFHGERAVSCANEAGCPVNPMTPFVSEDEAVRAWNDRASDRPAPTGEASG